MVPRPGDWEFLIDPPMANPVDLDILRMTALFAARNGRKFQTDLAQREATNYQFDFLQPSHSLFGYYNRLVAQYIKILQPEDLRLDRLALKSAPADSSDSRRADARREILRDLSDRVAWERWASERSRRAEEDAEVRRKAYAEIDWNDFVVVTTVEFTEADDLLDLPPPMLLEEVETMSMRQRRMAAMIMEGKEVMPDEDELAEQAIAEANQAAEDMQVDSDDDGPAPSVAPVNPAVDIRPADASAAMKIKSDYVPKCAFRAYTDRTNAAAQRAKKVATTQCTICGLQIPEDEINEHVRIELLDPRWKEKQAMTERNRSGANLLPGGANVTEALNKFASKRSDLFAASAATDAQKKAAADEEARLRRQREAIVWDGHGVSAEVTSSRFRDAAIASQSDIQEQIKALRRAHGVNVDGPNAPDIGPAAPGAAEARAAAAEAERKLIAAHNAAKARRGGVIEPHALAGASLSAAPNPGLQSSGPSGLPHMPEHAIPPEQQQAIAPPALPPSLNATRRADDAPDGEPAAKRARTAGGQLVPEQEWLDSHPVRPQRSCSTDRRSIRSRSTCSCHRCRTSPSGSATARGSSWPISRFPRSAAPCARASSRAPACRSASRSCRSARASSATTRPSPPSTSSTARSST